MALEHFEHYCFDCHDRETKKGNLDLEAFLGKKPTDRSLVFEHLITGRMPPAKRKQPTFDERRRMLEWLASAQPPYTPAPFRRLSRHEFVQSANDLLEIDLNLSAEIPEDRGTYDFETDRRIQLTQQMLSSYFEVTDKMLEFALPARGFPPEHIWVTSKIRDSHKTYNIYTRPYREGVLFSWTRANNGNAYSFFYDGFEPSVEGWYDLTFQAMKVGDFVEDVSLMVYAGKYFYADDRPQPQRLLNVISLSDGELQPYRIRAFLRPGENVSVHCYSKHNFRQREADEGIYIEQLKVQGPRFEAWPPESYSGIFGDLPLKFPPREATFVTAFDSELQAIGGRLSVSSQQAGMEKWKMQDGSNRTFWHSRFSPTLAEPPHFVTLENPNGASIRGLSYSAWSGGNGNGQVEGYAIYVSDDGIAWGQPMIVGKLETRLANEQIIPLPAPTNKRFLKFEVTQSLSLDGRSLASIGKLDVITERAITQTRMPIEVASGSEEELKGVIRGFARRAFVTNMTEEALEPYYKVGLEAWREGRDFVAAARLGIKAILGSHRFVMVPGDHANESYRAAAALARVLWLSVPDQPLLVLAEGDQLHGAALTDQIERMLSDPKSERMIHSLCRQWLNLRAFSRVTPSLKLYPLYDDLLNRYLPQETEAYLLHLIRENLPVTHLIDSNYSFLNQRLAEHYGIEGIVGQTMRRVSFSSELPRGGLLTMGSILKVTADGFQTSPILRGAWISKNIVGNTLSPPPENIEAIKPRADSEPVSLKARIDEHKNRPRCYACHKRIDPYGFALESFDATGQWRSDYKVMKPHKGTFQYRPQGYFRIADAVDPSGELDGNEFVDILEFKEILLSDHKKIAYNFVKKVFEYAKGCQPTLSQRLVLFAMIPEQADECRMKDLVIETLVFCLEGEEA